MNNGPFLSPRLLQLAGLVIIIGSLVYWVLSEHQSVLFVGAGLSLCTLGAYSGLRINIKQELYKEPPPEDDARHQLEGKDT